MFIKDIKKCEEIIAGDNTILRELLSPLKEEVSIRFSLAHAEVKPGEIYIPPNSIQRIKNTGMNDLIFLCIVDPAWKSEDEELV
jgi:mannose-6-phosphate isomerase-like protein (cupin superfamily)